MVDRPRQCRPDGLQAPETPLDGGRHEQLHQPTPLQDELQVLIVSVKSMQNLQFIKLVDLMNHSLILISSFVVCFKRKNVGNPLVASFQLSTREERGSGQGQSRECLLEIQTHPVWTRYTGHQVHHYRKLFGSRLGDNRDYQLIEMSKTESSNFSVSRSILECEGEMVRLSLQLECNIYIVYFLSIFTLFNFSQTGSKSVWFQNRWWVSPRDSWQEK